MQPCWHYLAVTAAHEAQAAVYEAELSRRRASGGLKRFDEVFVLADPGGRRIGSGGATINCLLHILALRRSAGGPGSALTEAECILRSLRILVLHAGGDSRRLPAYSPCGKIFVPLPHSPGAPSTLFDRLAGVLASLPVAPAGAGQLVVASGDALVDFDPAGIDLSGQGVTALAAPATPEEAARHGVFCPGPAGKVRLYLQKPDPRVQAESGALLPSGQALLDVGVMSFSAAATVALLNFFCAEKPTGGQPLSWRPHREQQVFAHGLDLYREICCALGDEATESRYVAGARSSGSGWPEPELQALYPALREIPFHYSTVPDLTFLHFGSTAQLISSGQALALRDRGTAPDHGLLILNTAFGPRGAVRGRDAWVEGCRIGAPLALGGRNVVVNLDIQEELALGESHCLDVLFGHNREGEAVWFVRSYGVDDSFKHPAAAGGTFHGMPLTDWLNAVGATQAGVWDAELAPAGRSLWTARVFPAEREPGAFTRWLWMRDPRGASREQKQAYLQADRYSAAEIALRADLDHFRNRRLELGPADRTRLLERRNRNEL